MLSRILRLTSALVAAREIFCRNADWATCTRMMAMCFAQIFID